ncbi:EAL domain-containing protein [Altericista sp. CCNU0014]|uniref:two-component system response regulator n=1 Tax=Altericista sp. CCNU0014 TaxID=3082949 RepID=UPI00384C6F60
MCINKALTQNIASEQVLEQPSAADILIVDDTLENLKLLSSMLTEQGYNVRKATTGQMALKAVQSLLPDLVLLDIMMPDLTGFEVCKQLKSQPQAVDLPIIFLSALDTPVDKVQAFEVGGSDYISKPFQIEEVLVRVNHHLALKAAHQEICSLNAKLEARVSERTQQLTNAHHRLREAEAYDPLTGLINRSTFIQQVDIALSLSKTRTNGVFAVLIMDCDRFKVINDALGHLVGDELLQNLAKPLSRLIRQNDHLARLGGDEFAILLNEINDIDQAVNVADRILSVLAQPFCFRGYEIFVNVSIGLVLGNTSYDHPEQLLRDADIAMYRAKASGRGQYQVFSSAMDGEAHRRLEIETDLHRALKLKEFRAHFQPIVDLATGTIAGFEALARWQHPKHGLIPPGEFLPIAEETGLICEIGRSIMEQACHQLQNWRQEGFSALMMYVNLSAQELSQPILIEEIDRILAETQLPSSAIKLEITESSMIQDLQTTILILNQLQERGIQLSIDDFGTGYSSLGQLQSLPVNTLKIDRAFTQQLDGTPETVGLVPVILGIAQVMDMDVVAEGIETEQQLAQLRELGCRYGQGFLFSRPVDAQTATQLIRSDNRW